MIVLGIESSALSAGAAVVKDGRLIAETYLNIGLTHSETLLSLVNSCLANASITVDDIDFFAVAKGPGSFTGIRIGISLVKGLAFRANKPVFGISTLEAASCGAMLEGYLICPVMDARCNQVYTAQFICENGVLIRKNEDSAIALEDLIETLKTYETDVLLLGDGAGVASAYFKSKHFERFTVFPEIFKYQRAAGVAFAAYMRYNNGDSGISPDSLTPSYLRPPQAERERNKGDKK